MLAASAAAAAAWAALSLSLLKKSRRIFQSELPQSDGPLPAGHHHRASLGPCASLDVRPLLRVPPAAATRNSVERAVIAWAVIKYDVLNALTRLTIKR